MVNVDFLLARNDKNFKGKTVVMFTNSTDAYQSALKIMGHEYANKYANYWTKKNKTIKSGKSNFKDLVDKRHTMQSSLLLQSTKLYPNNKKIAILNWKGTEKLFKKIAKSKTYQKLCENRDWFKWWTQKSNTL